MNDNPVPQNINVQELLRKGEELYQLLRNNLEQPDQIGKFLAIEVESKQYFLGETKDEAVAKAKKEFPDKIFVVRKIGEIERIAHHSTYFPYVENYDWLL